MPGHTWDRAMVVAVPPPAPRWEAAGQRANGPHRRYSLEGSGAGAVSRQGGGSGLRGGGGPEWGVGGTAPVVPGLRG